MKASTLAAAAALAFTFAVQAGGSGNAGLAEANSAYEKERALCNSGKSHQARATCLQEAGAAHEEAKRGALANAGGTDLQKNATQRCQAQPEADRAACVQRIVGSGTTEGSVKGGGVIRQTETKVP